MPIASSASLHVCCALQLFTRHPNRVEQPSCNVLSLQAGAYRVAAFYQERRALTETRSHIASRAAARAESASLDIICHTAMLAVCPRMLDPDVLSNTTYRCTQQAYKSYGRAEVAQTHRPIVEIHNSIIN